MDLAETPSRSSVIAELNDKARQTFTGCCVVVTAAFQALPDEAKAKVLSQVRNFEAFDEDNNPHGERDMAFFDCDGARFFWKYDYYAPDMQHGSEDPTNAEITRRVLTIGLASDY